jgi:hypothetical protein
MDGDPAGGRNDWNAVSGQTEVSDDGTNACSAGSSCLSSDCCRECAFAWHRLGCSISICSHPAMRTVSPPTCIVAERPTMAALAGHTYPASTSCINSVLTSAKRAPRIRERRGNFMFRYRKLKNSTIGCVLEDDSYRMLSNNHARSCM